MARIKRKKMSEAEREALEKEMKEYERLLAIEALDGRAATLPEFPPLCPGGDLSVRDMCSDLTEEEFEYVFSKYTGTMRKE